MEIKIRPNDYVRHLPSAEMWVVCGVDYDAGELIPCGHPFPSLAKISDCVLEESRGLPQTEELKNALLEHDLQRFILPEPEPALFDLTDWEIQKRKTAKIMNLIDVVNKEIMRYEQKIEDKRLLRESLQVLLQAEQK
ncbi:MAG: hypothetical protein AB9907_14810 [Flexilinea sp.]